jgi:hypothetical protein
MTFFPVKKYAILTDLSKDQINERLKNKSSDKSLDLEVYLNTQTNRRFADQLIKNSLSVESLHKSTDPLWYVNYTAILTNIGTKNKLDFKIELSLILRVLFSIWFVFFGLFIIVLIVSSIWNHQNILGSTYVPLLIVPSIASVIVFVGMYTALFDHERKSKEIFSGLFEGTIQ